MKPDITNRKDVEQLINVFYDRVKSDDVIGYIFNDIAKVNWLTHLPVMYDFWESVIFFTNQYAGNPMSVHINLNERTALTKEHFQRWLKIFTETVDKLFEGEKAVLAVQKATSIATIMQIKIIGGRTYDIPVKQ